MPYWKLSAFYMFVLALCFLQLLWLFAGVAGVAGVALLAGKRFLAGVWKHVILHTTVVTARIVALFTSKGLFSSVSELVSLQILRLSGGIVTLLTTERLLSWMDSHANHSILFCSNQGSPSFSKWSKSADILKFCPASSWRFWPLPCPAPALWCLERWLVKAPTPETSVILIQYSITSLTSHASNRVKIIIYHIYSILTDSLLLARFWQSSERDIRLFALSNEAICYNSNNIEILPIICFWGHA